MSASTSSTTHHILPVRLSSSDPAPLTAPEYFHLPQICGPHSLYCVPITQGQVKGRPDRQV
jgi:hypothetical protein